MIKLRHETLQKLMDRLIEEFEFVNKLNRNYDHSIPELPTANIIAPLYRYFSYPPHIQRHYEFISDLEKCPDFFPVFQSMIPEEEPTRVTIILKMDKEYGKYGDTYNPVNHNYVLIFTRDEYQKWEFQLEKTECIAYGDSWESGYLILDENLEDISYEDFIKDFNKSLEEKGGESK